MTNSCNATFRESLLEEALLEYIQIYGLRDKARLALQVGTGKTAASQ